MKNRIFAMRHGWKIKTIAFPDNSFIEFAKNNETARFQRDVKNPWIVVTDANNKELRCYNPRYVDCIIWED